MLNKERVMRILSIIGVLILSRNLEVESVGFKDNLINLKGTTTIEDSERFISNDKEYLNSSPRISNINKEISILELELKEVTGEYDKVKGIKIYRGNIGLKNNAIRTAIKNRKTYKNGKYFEYDDETIYNIDRDYVGEKGTNRYFTQKEMDMSYESIVEVINNIELDTEFLEDTTFVVSPFILDGVNGYTVTRNTDHSTIVMSNHVIGAPENWIILSTMSTVLHEIGHVFYNSKRKKFKNNSLAREYLVQTDKRLQEKISGKTSETQKWRASVNENFAEDFRVHYSKRLGPISFEPLSKKTLIEYNEEEFNSLLEEINN